MTPLSNRLDEGFDAAQEVARIARGRVSPIAASALGLDPVAFRADGGNVDAGKLGADDGGAGTVLCGGVAVADGAYEHGPSGPVSVECLLEGCARLGKSWRIGVVVERAQVC